MEQGVKEFLGLLRAFVHEAILTDQEIKEIDRMLPQMLHLAELHHVRGIWAYKIREYGRMHPDVVDADVAQTADRIFAVAIQKSIHKDKKYRELSQCLINAGVDHLPMKGIEVKRYYSVPELRTFSDIDIVIRPKDRERVHALMQELKYSVKTAFEPVYTYEREQEVYEIHTDIMSVNVTNRADYIGYFKKLWQYAEEKEHHLFAFTPEFHFIYMLLHIVKHIYGSGAGIRMYLDLAFYIKHMGDTMDWAWIQQEVNKLELGRFFCLAMDAVRRWFEVALPVAIPEIEEGLFRDFTAFTMESDVFGYAGRSRGEQVIRKTENARLRALKKTFFPSADVIKTRYTYLEKHPWLLPIAWLDRVMRNSKNVGRKLEESLDILTAKEEDIQERKQFYDKIGL